MIFVIDGDDVLLRTGNRKIEYMKRHFRGLIGDLVDNIRPAECSKTLLDPVIGHNNYMQMARFVYSREGTMPIEPVPGALEGVKALSHLGQIYVVSARTVEQTKNTEEWCRNHGFSPYVQDVYSLHDEKFTAVELAGFPKKVAIAKHLGASIFVDDDSRHMPNEKVNDIQFLLFGEAKREGVKDHIIIVKDWNAVVNYARILT